MASWEDVQTRKVEMQNDAVSMLTMEERSILLKALELELENRHLAHSAAAPEIRKKLRNHIIQEFK
jgi:hypothetical protein